MNRVTLALVSALVALAVAPTASAGTIIGVNDDGAKYGDPATFFGTMTSLGLTENVITVLWDPSRPSDIVEADALSRAVSAADASGVDVVLDVYPAKARALAADPTAAGAFARFVGRVAQTFPTVREFIVMNECNQPRFLQPQFSGSENASAAICGQALALAYDRLKAVDPAITVWGVGLSPRGNDRPDAPSNISTSPVRFLAALGRWYRASGRTAPLMDGLAFHPYPNSNRDPFGLGYPWPNVGAVNLDRLYQAFWDAFHGTAQPTFAETGTAADRTIELSLNEVGIQVSTEGSAAYQGSENVPAVQPADQAAWYSQLIAAAVCDPRVAALNFFHLVDERDRAGFQSGLFALDGARRYAADVVSYAPRTCTGALHGWRHTNGVVGSAATFSSAGVQVRAAEDARYFAGVFAVPPRGASSSEIERGLLGRATEVRRVRALAGSLRANRDAVVALSTARVPGGCYQLGVTLRATLNPGRSSSFAGPVLRVGARCAVAG